MKSKRKAMCNEGCDECYCRVKIPGSDKFYCSATMKSTSIVQNEHDDFSIMLIANMIATRYTDARPPWCPLNE